MLELILLLCSSGVAGLFTYIYLDYLSIFDTEKQEIKRMFSIMFSLISVGIFILVNNLIGVFVKSELLSISIALLVSAILIIFVLNRYVYIWLINIFRSQMNTTRAKLQKNTLLYEHAIDFVLSDRQMSYYIECYDDEFVEKASMYGLIAKHEVDDNLDVSFIISTTTKFTKQELSKSDIYYVYHKTNTTSYYKIYGYKD
ncbi:hypothetical protein BUY79_02320 [Staphylococcus equorum]|uniref:hypothetical protein n=1 Tax=Staphylococcus equorum TaxID=246432 RepID=UPI000D1CC070|nr:hypothetical protein [Staphylococcus equorum]PTE85603.1 hypothetical protein BUY79_02320 [Staphylococcus equorum]RIL48271.1 hypothetical protein BUY82_05680 [Staphylococcus equorum]